MEQKEVHKKGITIKKGPDLTKLHDTENIQARFNQIKERIETLEEKVIEHDNALDLIVSELEKRVRKAGRKKKGGE